MNETRAVSDAEGSEAILVGLVADEAPRVFAVVEEEEYGDRVDGRIAAWGMAFADRASIVGVQGGSYLSMRSPEAALRAFGEEGRSTPRLVWVNPADRQ